MVARYHRFALRLALTAYEDSLRHPQRRDHRTRRPRQDDVGRRYAQAERRLSGGPARRDAGARFQPVGKGARHHDSGKEYGRAPRRRQVQHRRHSRPLRFWRRGRARAANGPRGVAARRRGRGRHAPNSLRSAQGARARPTRDCRGEQDRPQRCPRARSRQSNLRSLRRSRRQRQASRFPGSLHQRKSRNRQAVVRRPE